MKKNTLAQIIIIVILTVILAFLVRITIKSIDDSDSFNPNMQQANGNMPGQMNNSNNVTYSSNKEITESTTLKNEEISSSNADENAVSITGDIDATIKDSRITKTGDSDGGDTTSFYGTNSALIAKDGVNLNLDNMDIITNATGANGVFCYGGSATTNNSNSDGTTITISDSKITTSKDNSGGIMTTGGGTMIANNLTINTAGTSSAAIRTDRGGGDVTVNGGTYTTTGQGSPSIYSTAKIVVNDANLIAKVSEGIVIEGKNSVTINNCNLTDSNTKLNGQSTTYKNIFLYQSMSGDAADGNSEFCANNSNIVTNNGDTFYVTNTTATIKLNNNKITNNDNSGNFLRVQKDSWGNSGSNGGDVTFEMVNQKALGNIIVDSISKLDMSMKESSYFEGVINGDNTAKTLTLKLDASSKIKLTGDSYITSLEDSDTSYSNIDFNGYKLYVNGVAIL